MSAYLPLEKITNLLPDLRRLIHREEIALDGFRIHAGDAPGAQAVDWDDSGWEDFPLPGVWGGFDQFAWFRAVVSVPPAWTDQKVALRFLVGPRDGYGSTAETLLYVNGQALQAIDIWHEEAVIPSPMVASGSVCVALRAWAGVLNPPPHRHFKLAQLARIDEATERFYHLAHTIVLALPLLDENDLRRIKLLGLLNQAVGRIDFVRCGSDAFYRSMADALAMLDAGLALLRRDEIKPTVIAVGHSHIDLAWLWRMERTREKAERTFTTVLHLMNQYPEYRFAHSSPQLYDFIRRDHPALYERIRQRQAEGRWEVLGGSWVEMDTLIPSGESLVRQVLFGKRFTRREFGGDPKVLWLPDSFGFTALLPTILQGAGIEGFFTAVVSYSRFNRYPYDTFRWRGPDGSQVLVNFITTPAEGGRSYNYIGRLEPDDTVRTWNNNRQKEFFEEVLLPFGWGDGGGGPTMEMLQQARAMQNLPGLPHVEVGLVEPFFERLQRRVRGADLPLVDGEVYLENLRGAFTSQARTKRANRKTETLFHDAEWLSALADGLRDQAASHRPMHAAWEILLRNQFHDILSGTSIAAVHADAEVEFAQAQAIGQAVWKAALRRVCDGLRTPERGLLALNPTAWPRSELLEVPQPDETGEKILVDDAGRGLPSQATRSGTLYWVREVPAWGYRFFALRAGQPPAVDQPVRVTERELRNRFFSLRLDKNGAIARLRFGPQAREALPAGQAGNQLQFFEDRPLDGDAWQIEPFYQEKPLSAEALVESAVEESGPLRGVIRQTWRFHRSTITQRLVIYIDQPRIDFVTELDWHEHQVMLKAAFPLAVRARHATYDLSFAALERPTHWNTPFDAAHFENPLQQWVDLSEPGFGAALLNDCKYGCDVKDNQLRLTLHRSPTNPDPTADQGVHHFTYSLWLHDGDWRTANLPRRGRELNDPLQAAWLPANPRGELPAAFSMASCAADNIILETVKRAEDDDGWIVRLFEAHQVRGAARVHFCRPLRHVAECNLLEEELRPLSFEGAAVTLSFRPYEIKTLKVRFVD